MRILMVEDDPDQLLVRSMVFRQKGFDVVEANSYSAAMNAAGAIKVECAVIDLRLPLEREGIRLLGDLKKACPELPVYVLTGSQVEGLVSSWPELALAEKIFAKGSSIRSLLETLRVLQAGHQDV